MENADKKFYGLGFASKFKLLIVVLIALASLFGGASFLVGGMHSATIRRQSPATDGTTISSSNPLGIDDKVEAADVVYVDSSWDGSHDFWYPDRNSWYSIRAFRSWSSLITAKINQSTIPEHATKVSLSGSTQDVYVLIDYIPNSGGHFVITFYTKANCKITIRDAKKMFYNFTGCKTIDLTNFQLDSSATDLSSMFEECNDLQTVNGLNGLNTSNVTNMSKMFYMCHELETIDVSKFNTSKVVNMSNMFYGCYSLTSLNVSKFDTSNVVNMAGMFGRCSELTSLDVSNFNTSKVTNMGNMFACPVTSLNLSNFDTSKVTNMSGMFHDCRYLKSLDLSNFDTSEVTNMSNMFACPVTSLNLSNFDTSKVTNMSEMFSGCSSLTSLDVSNFDTSKVTNMSEMFSGCSLLTLLDVSNFNTSNVTDMSGMFSGCSSLTTLDFSNFNTSKVTDMSYMFQMGTWNNDKFTPGPSLLSSLNLSSFNTSNVATMYSMFRGCISLTSLNLSNFTTSKLSDMSSMFECCSSLVSLDISNFDLSKIDSYSLYKVFDGCSSLCEINTHKSNGREKLYLPNYQNSEYNRWRPVEGTSAIYYDGDEMPMGIHLGREFPLNLDENGGTEAKSDASFIYGSKYLVNTAGKVTAKALGVSREGYTLLGWYTAKTGGEKIIDGDTFQINQEAINGYIEKREVSSGVYEYVYARTDLTTLTLYAVWEEDRLYTINFQAGIIGTTGTTSAMVNVPYSGGETGTVLNANGFKKAGCSFAGWKITSDLASVYNSGGEMYSGNSWVSVVSKSGNTYSQPNLIPDKCKIRKLCIEDGGSVTLTTQWTPNTITITLDQTGATTNSKLTKIHYTYGKNVYYEGETGSTVLTDMSKLVPKRSGYVFLGYYTETDGGGTKLFDADGTPRVIYSLVNVNKIVYPHWALSMLATDWRNKVREADLNISSIKSIAVQVGSYVSSGGVDVTYNGETGGVYATYNATSGALTFHTNADFVYLPFNCSNIFADFTYLQNIQLNHFDTSKVTNMGYMFSNCSKLTSLDVSNFDTSKVTNMTNMFYGCSKLTTLDVGNFNTSKVTSMSGMFAYCNALTSLNVSNYDTSNVLYMDYMFNACVSLTSLDLSNFNTSKVMSMSHMFSGRGKLISLDLSSFDTSSVTDMSSMFYLTNIVSLNLSSFDTSNVINFREMFAYGDGLRSLDLSNWNTSKATSMYSMFFDCSALMSLNISNFEVNNSCRIDDMIVNCSSLCEIYTPKTIASGLVLTPPSGAKYRNVDGGTAEYSRSSTNGFPANMHLGRTCNLTLDTNGGTITGSTPVFLVYGSKYLHNSSGKITTTNFGISKAGSTLLGLYTAKTGGTKIVDATFGINKQAVNGYIEKRAIGTGYEYVYARASTSALTLCAQWSVSKYNIVFNGGTGATGQLGPFNNCECDKLYQLRSSSTVPEFTRADYDFAGWKITSGANLTSASKYFTDSSNTSSGVQIVASTILSRDYYVTNLTDVDGATVTLTAQWTKKNIVITLNQSNATTNSKLTKIHYVLDTEVYYEGETGSTVLSDTIRIVPKRQKYSFEGYYTQLSGGTKLISANGTPISLYNTIRSNSTLYPHWVEPILASDWAERVINANLGVSSKSSIKRIEVLLDSNVMSGGVDVSVSGGVYAKYNASSGTITFHTNSGLIYLPQNSSSIFANLNNLQGIQLSDFNTSKVTNMANMFSGCSSLQELDLAHFATNSVSSYENMFKGCAKIAVLDLSSFITSSAVSMVNMFMNCTELTSLNLSKFEIINSMNSSGMISGCEKIKEFVTPNKIDR